jgi:SAM-dependent methyltransferase
MDDRPRRSAGVRWLKHRLYDGQPRRFEELARAHVRAARRVLVFGAGRGRREFDLRGPGREVVGVDVSPDVLANPQIDRGVVYDGRRLPFPDRYFDLCCTQSVIEHLPDPAATFVELARVLEPGGRLVLKTPNKWFYAMLVSRLVPNRLHARVIRFATGRAARDVFPTVYRANTLGALRRLLPAAGFIEVELHGHLHGAGYLEWSLPSYLAGVLYERVVNLSPVFEPLRGHFVGEFIKP